MNLDVVFSFKDERDQKIIHNVPDWGVALAHILKETSIQDNNIEWIMIEEMDHV